jgi:hypothetical protein
MVGGPVRFEDERGVFFTNINDVHNISDRNITRAARRVHRDVFM